MSALVDEIGRRGAHHLIDETATRAHGGVGVSRCVTLLLVLAYNADGRGEVFWAIRTLAKELGIPKTDVANALAVLEASELIGRTGQRKGHGVVVYRFTDPDSWRVGPTRPTRSALVDKSRRVSGEVSGELSGELSGISRTRREEEENSSSNARARDEVRGGARVGGAAAEMASPRTTDPDDPDVSSTPDVAVEPPMLIAAPGASMSTSDGGEIRSGGDLAELAADLRGALGARWPSGHEAVALAQQRIDAGATVEQLVEWLGKRASAPNIGNPQGLIRTILRDPGEQPPRPKGKLSLLPPYCGHCDPAGRWVIGDPDDPPRHCRCYTEVTEVALDRQRRMAAAIENGERWVG